MEYPIRVLIIEDSSFMRKALAHRIEMDARFSVIDTAGNGAEGIEKALRLQPDVITLDIEMPVMDGLEALKVIVVQTAIPVVMVSAITEAGAQATLEALAIGAIDFIPKSKGAELIHETLAAAAQSRKPASRRAPAAPVASRVPALPQAAYQSKADASVIVIGSSTGGPQALHHVISALPKRLPMPVVIAQHMPPQFTAALARNLNETCALRVSEAKNRDLLEPGRVYIAPGGMQMRVVRDHIAISACKGESFFKPSVGILAQSVLECFEHRVLAIMLTGMGNDGAREFVALRKAGGYVIAQDQASCVVYGMPRAVVEGGGADETLPLEKIGERIVQLAC